MPEGKAVQSMFAGIAGRYDVANHLLSFGVDYHWRKVLVNRVAARRPQDVVDLATGSGDVAFALKKRLGADVTVQGLDFCEPMLDEARRKQKGDALTESIRFAFGDCLNLPLADQSVDVITISFGLRNLEDRHRGLQEMRRALRPGGALLVLEFTQPDAWLRPFYYAYLKGVLPLVAKAITSDKGAYEYLGGSIASFPARPALAEEMRAAGFDHVTYRGLTGGIVALHEASVKG
ncbi:MAG: bifunctional demethylmenaquinone methyltransferase/2-methoxy-6-polyprenyl-1,4-benzoquinol methylase UbiE [Verrucomicrobiota bacterium JB022]|nr:bifunctional demethylmenaquinone methyltransferase/2-methoxy-6-polyprenyl-1,4-benzoquinol methylase UbiE [Verrucomicrobiota bacterium JB022]